MIVEIFELKPTRDGDYVINPRRRVATVTVGNGRGDIRVFDKEREELVRGLFENPSLDFVGGGNGTDGIRRHPSWTPEAVEATLKKLFGWVDRRAPTRLTLKPSSY